jgi:hypothetical protein
MFNFKENYLIFYKGGGETPSACVKLKSKESLKACILAERKKERKGMNEPMATPLAKKNAPKKAKESKEKKKQYLTFPSGLRLEISKDKEAAEEWYNPAMTPLECFKKKFPKKSKKDIDKSSLDFVENHYIQNVPIVKIKPEDLDKKISKYFRVRDLIKLDSGDIGPMTKKGTWSKHEKFMTHDKDGKYYWNVARIDPNLCRTLDNIRARVGSDIKVDEGVRSYAYNKDMYMAKFGKQKETSPHISGKAVDLSRPTVDLGEIYEKLEKKLAAKNSKLRAKDPKRYEELKRNLYIRIKKDLDKKDAKLVRAIWDSLAGKGGGWGYGLTVYHVDVKIQNGPGGKGGSWELDEKTGKVKLRLRTWPY